MVRSGGFRALTRRDLHVGNEGASEQAGARAFFSGGRRRWGLGAAPRRRSGQGRAAGRCQIAALRLRAVLVCRALAAALASRDARGPPGHGAALVAHALDALALGAAGGPARITAGGVAVALDAGAARRIADPVPAATIGGARAGELAAAALGVAGARAAVRVDETLDAAAVPRITDAAGARAGVDALDARARHGLAARPVRRAVCIERALHAESAAIAGRVSRLGAVGVGDALHTQADLRVADALRLAGALARLGAALSAAAERLIAALARAAIGVAAALDADAADAGGAAPAAVLVDGALDAGAARAAGALARAIARLTALGGRPREVRKQLECPPLIQLARERDRPEHDGHGREPSHGSACSPHGCDADAGPPAISAASARAKPRGWRRR